MGFIFAFFAAVSFVAARIPGSEPTPIADAMLYGAALFYSLVAISFFARSVR